MPALKGLGSIHVNHRDLAVLDGFLEFFHTDIGILTGIQKGTQRTE